MVPLGLEELLREIRARTSGGGERTVALYGRPLDANAQWSTDELIAEAIEKQRALYGPEVDSRRELYESAADPTVARVGAAVAVLVESRQLTPTAAGWSLAHRPFAAAYGLGPEERFRDQPCAGFCSGCLVAPRILATAAHCIRGVSEQDRVARLAQIRVVFGFHMIDAASARTVFADDQVYRPERLVGRSGPDTGDDWALLELDRDVRGVAPLAVRRAGKVADGARVAVIGHPCGIPAKYASGATVRRNRDPGFFRANLDTFGGNSGSPVFDRDGLVEGLLVRGAPDFVRDAAGFHRALIIPVRDDQDDPPGEDCVRAPRFAAGIPG